MKILIVHYRYYEASGPEKYLFGISKLLEDKGHTVIPFSLNYSENKESEFSEFFPKPIVSNFHINDVKNELSLKDKVRIIKRSFYNLEVYKKLSLLIKETKPDVAYILQYGTKLTISIFDAIHRANIPTVLRISDFNLICAKNTLYRQGHICTSCTTNKLFSIVNRCVHNSLAQSLIYYCIQKYNEFSHFERKIDAFIAPSTFTISTIKNTNQYKSCKFVHIPTFVNQTKKDHLFDKSIEKIEHGLKLCYVGRISDEKGLDLLIDAIYYLSEKNLSISLDIYGDDNCEYAIIQKQKVLDLKLNNVIFKGYMDNKSIINIYSNYHFSIIPSKCFDNMPNSLIESCMNGVPVIASRIGSLQELIHDGINGYTFEAFRTEDLASLIEFLVGIDQSEYNKLSMNSQSWASGHCDKDTHCESLIDLFTNVIYEKNYK